MPAHWIPFLPVAVDATRGDVALERGTLSYPVTGDTVEPLGRVLRPTGLAAGESYKVREEEVSRFGVRVSRLAWRSRSSDGSTHLWLARRETSGPGEASSELRFDVADL